MNDIKLPITEEYFRKVMGHDPEDDDLDRSNCSLRGVGHMMCGWCVICNAPFYECGGFHETK